MAQQILTLTPNEVAAIGRAFTEILLTFPEEHLPNVAFLGSRLLAELRARGLNVAPMVRTANTLSLRIAP